MSKQKNFFSNGNKIWVWILIVAFIVSLIAQAAVNTYRNAQTFECSKKNEERSIENDKRLAVIEEQIGTLIETQKEMNRKLDRALGR